MCDYSLAHLVSRQARQGETLVLQQLGMGSKGFVNPVEWSNPASKSSGLGPAIRDLFFEVKPATPPVVCIPPTAKLRLSGLSEEVQRKYGVGLTEDVTFTQIDVLLPNQYHDAVQFKTGKPILLQYLNAGVKAEVLTLDTSAAEEIQMPQVEERELVRVR